MLIILILTPFIGENSRSGFRTWDDVIQQQGQDMLADYLGLKMRLGEDELNCINRIYQ